MLYLIENIYKKKGLNIAIIISINNLLNVLCDSDSKLDNILYLCVENHCYAVRYVFLF